MKQITKVLSINVTAEELKDIRAAYKKMVAGLEIKAECPSDQLPTPKGMSLQKLS